MAVIFSNWWMRLMNKQGLRLWYGQHTYQVSTKSFYKYWFYLNLKFLYHHHFKKMYWWSIVRSCLWTLAQRTLFFIGIKLLSIYIMYIYFIIFLEGQSYQNVLKRNFVHKLQWNALAIFCELWHTSWLHFTNQKLCS